MKILEIDKSPKLGPDDFGITWEVTGNCTFDCRYCVLHYKDPIVYPQETIDLINDLSNRKNLILTLFGGEPTLHPDFLKILGSLNSNIKLGVFSNLSKGVSYFAKVLKLRPDLIFETSYHPSQTNLESYCETLQYLVDHGANLDVAFMYDTTCDNLRETYARLESICPSISPYMIDNPDVTRPPDEKWFIDNTRRTRKIDITYKENGEIKQRTESIGYMWANQLNNFKLYRCDCGKSNFYISSQGGVYPCLDYKKNDLGEFFSVYDDYSEDLERVLKEGVICKSSICTSEIDVHKKRILNI